VTKVFTALILVDMVRQGEVDLRDPVAQYLSPKVNIAERAGRSITLQELATHTSSLPGMPDNFLPGDPSNPCADYSVEQLYGFLSGHQLTRDVGSHYEYSNLGFGLLGHALAQRAGLDYEALVRGRVLQPLGMTSTAVTLSSELRSRLSHGHDHELAPVSNWDLTQAFAGAGALRSTADDLLNFLAAVLGYRQPPLTPAMDSMLAVRRSITVPASQSALGWVVTTRGDDELVWHSGGTGGYRSFVGYLRRARVGVVVLSNASTEIGGDDIGNHLLDRTLPLAPPPKRRKEVRVDPTVLDGYVGRYRLAHDFIVIVTRDDDRLFVEGTGQGRYQVFPESERDFFYKVVDAQITFDVNERGLTTGLTLHQGGQDALAPRIGD
jgi:serine-type D-Ala-D-Ala carboxypeptidase/endopeptidase